MYAGFLFYAQRFFQKSEPLRRVRQLSLIPFGWSAALGGKVYFHACMRALLVLTFATFVNVAAAINDGDDDGDGVGRRRYRLLAR